VFEEFEEFEEFYEFEEFEVFRNFRKKKLGVDVMVRQLLITLGS